MTNGAVHEPIVRPDSDSNSFEKPWGGYRSIYRTVGAAIKLVIMMIGVLGIIMPSTISSSSGAVWGMYTESNATTIDCCSYGDKANMSTMGNDEARDEIDEELQGSPDLHEAGVLKTAIPEQANHMLTLSMWHHPNTNF